MSITKQMRNQLLTPKVQPAIISSSQVNSPEIEALRKANAELKQQVETKQKELESNLALQAARKIQADHDRAESIKAKQQAPDKTGISIVRNNPTNADMVEAGMLAILNAKREREGLRPVKSYMDYLASFQDTPAKPDANKISIVPNTGVDPVTPLDKLVELSLDYSGRPLKAQCEVYQVVNGGYFVAYNKFRCYIQKLNKEVNILVQGDTLYGDMSLMSIIPNKSFRDLTRGEFDNIIKSKPTYADLFMVYSKFRNCQNVQLDTKNALPVW